MTGPSSTAGASSTATSEPVSLSIVGPIAIITLTQPTRGNSFDLSSARSLLDAVTEAESHDVAVLGLRAQGRFFCVGGDIQSFAAASTSPSAYFDELTSLLHRAISKLIRLDAIVVAAVHGAAAGAGVALAAAADIVLAARSASFTLAYTAIGLTPDGGSTALLPPSLGLHRSLYLALLNPRLSAEEAKTAGLVAEVLNDEILTERFDEVLAQLAAGAHQAQANTKRLLRSSMAATAETHMELEARSMIQAATHAEGIEGVDAFLTKRPPQFPA